MKNHFAITISDAYGSRHYTVKKAVKHYLAVTVLVTFGSLSYNFLQYWQTDTLHNQNAWFDLYNSNLSERLAFHNQQARDIHQVLSKIEHLARVNTGDDRTALVQRIRTIGQFYYGKEEEYSGVDARLAQIEKMMSTMNNSPDPSPVWNKAHHTIASRADMAALSVQQETAVHNTIPSGSPTKTRIITSKFGNRIHPVTKVKSFHHGVDIRTKGRVSVHATADGIVRAANYSKLSGNRVVVQHNFGFESYYAHLHKMNVKPGDIIHKGDMVGRSGNSGQSAGPHLHYEVRYLGKPVDPVEFLKWEFGSHEIFTQIKDVKWLSLINLINKRITHPTLRLSQLEPVLPERSR